MAKDKFIIEPHFRLHEWVAEEKGYFKDEGLDYEFRELVQSTDGSITQARRQGRRVPDLRARPQVGHLLRLPLDGRTSPPPRATASSTPMSTRSRPPASSCRPTPRSKKPEDLAGVPISVGYQSGSHYSTIQALEQYMPHDKINLSFADGLLFGRMDKLLDGRSPACTLFSGPYYFAEQLGFRKVIDTTFMIGDHAQRRARSRGRAEVLPRAAARAARHRSAAGPLHPLLQERVPRALPRQHGHAPLGPRRAHRVRALHEGDLRRDLQVDRRARHLR